MELLLRLQLKAPPSSVLPFSRPRRIRSKEPRSISRSSVGRRRRCNKTSSGRDFIKRTLRNLPHMWENIAAQSGEDRDLPGPVWHLLYSTYHWQFCFRITCEKNRNNTIKNFFIYIKKKLNSLVKFIKLNAFTTHY